VVGLDPLRDVPDYLGPGMLGAERAQFGRGGADSNVGALGADEGGGQVAGQGRGGLAWRWR
jgi:hypothetical protein